MNIEKSQIKLPSLLLLQIKKLYLYNCVFILTEVPPRAAESNAWRRM